MRVAFPGLKDSSSTPSDKLELSFTGPLVLTGNPTEAKEAANKNVVDSSFASLDASKMIDGTLTVDRLPEYTGDVGNVAGNNLFTLNPTGVSSGNHSKVTVDSKGRVVGAAGLEVTDIPPFDWTKITRNKPVSLNGYGITDGIKKSGDVIDGELVSGGLVTQDLHAATKEYVEGVVSAGGSNVNVGAVVSSSVEGLVGGFLRANGAEVSKAAYAELYSVLMSNVTSTIRLDYTSYAAMGAGQPWKQQYDFKVSSGSDITGWSIGVSIHSGISEAQSIVTKNRVYLLGGNLNGNTTSQIYTATIGTDGTIGAWSTAGSLPNGIHITRPIVIKNRVYLISNLSFTGGGYLNTIYYADIDTLGNIGNFSVYSGSTLISLCGYGHVIITKNRVYLLGGYSPGKGLNGYSGHIEYANIDSTGNIGAFTSAGNLISNLLYRSVVVTKNRVYLIGGVDGNGNFSNLVETATINSDGSLSSWTASSNFPIARAYGDVVVTKNRVYIIGGSINTGAIDVVYTAPINSDGTLGSWTTGTQLPATNITPTIAITNNKVNIIGGWTGTVSNIYVGTLVGNEPLSDYSKFYDGSINKFDGSDLTGDIVVQQGSSPYDTLLQPGNGKPWKQQYEINTEQSTDITGWTAGTSLPGSLGQSQAIVTKNRVYLLGGYNSSGYMSIVYTAPINTDGTLGTWTTGTSLPGNLTYSQAIVTKNRVYLLGGHNGSVWASTVYTASINVDGTLGTWTTDTSLPGGLGDSQAIVTKNRVYLLGGVNSGNYVSTIYTAPINEDGTLGVWTTGTSLPGTLARSQAIVTKNRVYLLGGDINGIVSTVYTAPINTDGTLGTWTTGTSLPGTLAYSQAIVTKNRVYLLGGYTNIGGSSVSTVYTAPINEDGTLGTWTTGTSLPGGLFDSQAIVTKNRVYLLGGISDGGYVATICTAPILGGLNDYALYYDGTITPTDPNNFKLPDYSSLETISEKYYIKY